MPIKEIDKMNTIAGKRKYFYLTAAHSIFVVHTIFVIVISVGWAIPGIFYVYLPMLITSLISEIILGYCVLTKWEFDIRKKLYPALNFGSSFIGHYARKIFRIGNSVKSVQKKRRFSGLTFSLILLSSLALGIVFQIFVYV